MPTISIDANVYLLVTLNIISFTLGYLWCKSTIIGQADQPPISFLRTNSPKISAAPLKIDIDSSKFVGDIKTNDLQKKFDNIGETKKSEENIKSSVDKLKNIKK